MEDINDDHQPGQRLATEDIYSAVMRMKSPELVHNALIKEVQYSDILIKKKGSKPREATPDAPSTMLSEPTELLVARRHAQSELGHFTVGQAPIVDGRKGKLRKEAKEVKSEPRPE